MSKISVIIPVYKVEPYLRRCVDSLLSQTYQDYELILVDDGSPDDCGRICDEYAEKYDNIHVIHKENGGLSSARNAGIDYAMEHSDSEWLTFVDSDDYLHPRYLEQLYLAAVENGVEISVCAYIETDGASGADASQDCATVLFAPEQLWVKMRGYAVVAVCKLYKKALFESVRYPQGKLHEDEFTTYKLLFACDRIAYFSAQLYYYFQNSSGIMRSVWTPRRLDALEAIKEQVDYFKKNKFNHAYKKGIVDYARTICFHMESVQTSEKYGTIFLDLQKTLRRFLKKHYFRIPIRYCQGIYLVAFPKRKNLILAVSGLHRFAVDIIKRILGKQRG